MSAGLVSARVNARKSGNGVSVGKPGHIPKLRHKLRAERIAYTVHGHDHRVFRELGCQGLHFSLEPFHRGRDSVQRINGLPDHGFGQSVLGEHGNQVLCSGVDLNGFALAEVVAMPFTPLTVTLGKGSEAHVSHTVHMPKGRGKVHPLLAAVLTDRAVK